MGNRKEVLENIQKAIEREEYDCHVDPINYDIALKVDEHFQYIKKGFTKIKCGLESIFCVKPYTTYIWHKYHASVEGRNNIRGIKNAIVTCNHVDMFDCLIAKKALKGHKTYITAASFNNQKGFLGELMRAGNMMPFSEDMKALRNMNKAIETLLTKNKYVMFYPEQSMWWHYEVPRPLKIGAFHYAMKHNVPVIPLFITFSPSNRMNDEGINLPDFHVHILKPIYPVTGKTRNEAIKIMLDKNKEEWDECYQAFYGKKA